MARASISVSSRKRFLGLFLGLGLTASALTLFQSGTVVAESGEGVAAPTPPVAKIVPHELTLHGITRTDNYYWLNQKENPEVIAHLEAENAYADAMLADLKPIEDELYSEMEDRLDDEEKSVPYTDNGYVYETVYEEGADYETVYRTKVGEGNAREVLLDVTKMAEGHDQYNLNNWSVSPDNRKIAYAVDFSGDRVHTIFVRDIATGEVSAETVTGAGSDIAWAADGSAFLYIRVDPQTIRDYQVWRHTVGTPVESDVMVMEEPDDTFSFGVGLTKSREFIVILDYHRQWTQAWVIPASDPAATPVLIAPKVHGESYFVDHVGDYFYIRTNKNAPDYKIVRAPEADPSQANWEDVVPHTEGFFISNYEVFERFIVIDQSHDAVISMRIIRLDGGPDMMVPRDEDIGVGSMGDFSDAVNLDVHTTKVRYGFMGPITPTRIYEFDVDTGELVTLKEDPVVRWFDPAPYTVERIEATAPDGEKVPVTLVYRTELKREGGNPLLIQGYGAYGSSEDPIFRTTWFSLVDRGFVYAIAHIRGGREMGQRWYEGGRMANKRNTFTDFIAATEAVIASGLADPSKVFARGGSAGGLLVGAVANLRPDLYNAIVAEVPFVDVLTTMSDATIPLTTFEYEEWGNPEIREQYDWMAAYSPYDNVRAVDYPALYITTGLNDSQVGYFEPAKWVARLRATETGNSEIYFRTNMGAGHGGDSGRLGWLEERAQLMAFLVGRARE